MKYCILILLITCNLGIYSQDFKSHIVFLSSEKLHGRYPATSDEKIAAEYIKSVFKNFNLQVITQKFPFENDSAINVIGIIDLKKDSTIIISAHYDHLGYGNGKSLDLNKKGIHPGADDNASGVAMLLELAKVLSIDKEPKYNIVFAAWSAHETGLFGSYNFTKTLLFSKMKIASVINIDMVGRLNLSTPVLRISGADSNAKFTAIFKKLENDSLKFRMDDENIYQSDLKNFAILGIPVLNFTTGIHNDYHRKSDTEDKINYTGMLKIYSIIQKTINLIINEN